MVFDPFGDYDQRGYLRNHAGEKDMEKVKNLEHVSFKINVAAALENLKDKETISFEDVKETHRILFSDVYPWAGEDRAQNASDLHVTKGSSEFALPHDVELATDYALSHGNDQNMMRKSPGAVMGELAYAHPFLDGNGRTIMTVHAELSRRAGIHVDWAKTNKKDYLDALTKELDDPDKGHLDKYLKPYVREGRRIIKTDLSELNKLPGLNRKELTKREVYEAAIEKHLNDQFPNDPHRVKEGVERAKIAIDKALSEGKELKDIIVRQQEPEKNQAKDVSDKDIER